MSRTDVKYSVAALCLFGLSLGWLYLAIAHENRTRAWTPTSVVVTSNDADIARSVNRRSRGVKSWLTTVTYQVDGVPYEAVVDEYLVRSNVTVYVNPEDPREVFGKAGATIQGTFYPILASVFTGLLTVVLGLILFSPKED